MAQTTFTVRMDADTKREFNELCANIGMSMSTAFSIFAKKAVSEQRIPFDLTANTDPFYSAENIAEIKRRIADVQSGASTLKEHDLIEVDDE